MPCRDMRLACVNKPRQKVPDPAVPAKPYREVPCHAYPRHSCHSAPRLTKTRLTYPAAPPQKATMPSHSIPALTRDNLREHASNGILANRALTCLGKPRLPDLALTSYTSPAEPNSALPYESPTALPQQTLV